MATKGFAHLDSVTGKVPVAEASAANSTIQNLSTTPGIDGTQLSTTTLYTPSGLSLVTFGVIVRVTASVGIISVCSLSVGQNAGVDDIIPITPLTNLNATGKYLSVIAFNPAVLVPSGTPIKIKITTAYVATSITLAVDLCGYLL